MTDDAPSIRSALLRSLAAGLVAGLPCLAAAQGAGDGSLVCGGQHVVVTGDTLSKLAARAYGDASLFGRIAEANSDALGGNPENLAVGMSLAIPCIDAATGPATTMQQVVTAEGVLSPDQLDTLLGPIALFPDKILTPVLVATTFPLDVVKAARFVEETSSLSAKERSTQAATQPWDDSVRELAAGFPQLLTRMNDNLDWTEQAGESVVAQTDDVLASIQRLRSRAQTNGYLVDNEAQTVETQGDKIVIAPSNPNVVYVPAYDSQVVYSTPVTGAPVYRHGYEYGDDWTDWNDVLVTGGILLGGAVILDEIFDDDDWGGWDVDDDIDWDRGDITIDRGDRNIERGDINIDRSREGGTVDRDRVSIGSSDRIQVDRGDRANLADRAGGANRPGAGNVAANRKSISTPANRDAARQKIETRKATGQRPANLDATRKKAQGSPGTATRQRADRPATGAQPRNTAAKRTTATKPKANRSPAARSPSKSNTFKKPSGGPRPQASASRGRSSMGSRGGGGRGGGGGGGGRRR